ncbi:MAG: phytanoyl-CoA dioxygenase family protein [Pirellulales bacterium]|nr:phytanoyl-CoA dioxygenase family protein [Pirellulales bacterium]
MLSAALVDQYRQDGYTVARQLFSPPEVARLRDEALALWERCGQGAAAQNTNFLGVKKMSTVRDPQLHSALFTRTLTDPRLTEAMADLVGPNVQLHHSKINIKTREDRAVFPLHQDQPYFPHARHSVCTVLVHLTTTSSSRGCFRVIPGIREPLPHVADDGHILDPVQYPLERAQELPAEAGDVVFMNYLVPHGSNLHDADEPRMLWIIQVRAAEDRPIDQPAGTEQPTPAGNRPSQGTMLRGINPDFAWAAAGNSSRL